jgi:hypothetical protein
MDWLYKCSQIPGSVIQKSQLKSGLSLSLAFSSYMLGTHAAEDTDESFIESSGLETVGYAEKKAKFFSTKAGRCQSIAVKLTGITGLVYISLAGHALGYRQQGGWCNSSIQTKGSCSSPPLKILRSGFHPLSSPNIRTS